MSVNGWKADMPAVVVTVCLIVIAAAAAGLSATAIRAGAYRRETTRMRATYERGLLARRAARGPN